MTPFAPWFRPYVELENEATELRSWQSIVVNGLLQIPEYAGTLLSTQVGTSEDEVEQRVAACLQRQERPGRPNPPLLWVVMDEVVFRRPVGGGAIMLAQIEHIAVVAERHNVVVQVVPMAAGAHDGITDHLSSPTSPRLRASSTWNHAARDDPRSCGASGRHAGEL
jgi:hypothetical protein